MRKDKDFEIELPWQVVLVLMSVATVAAALAVCLGWVFFVMIVNDPLQAVLASFGSSTSTPLKFTVAWPLPLLAFAFLSVRFYLSFKRVLVRRLTMF
jgi:hypothetical protein